VLDRGVLYQTAALGFEAPDRQQIVVEQFTQQAENWVNNGPANLQSLTPAGMRDFVVSPKLYIENSYTPPAGATASALPTPIRQLKEVTNNQTYNNFPPPPGVPVMESPLVAAQSELTFRSEERRVG